MSSGPNVINFSIRNLRMFAISRRVFAFGKYYQPSLMVESKAGAYPCETTLWWCATLWEAPGLAGRSRGHNVRILFPSVIYKFLPALESVCPWQAFPAYFNVCE